MTGEFASGAGKGGGGKNNYGRILFGLVYNEENEFGELPKLKKGYNFEASLAFPPF